MEVEITSKPPLFLPMNQAAIRSKFANLIDASANKLTVTIGGDDYDAVKTVLNRDIRYQVYGTQSNYSFSVVISWADFSSIPAIDGLVTISGTEYRIMGSETDSTDVSLRLDLGQKYG